MRGNPRYGFIMAIPAAWIMPQSAASETGLVANRRAYRRGKLTDVVA
jgi:hypothetical protein